MFFRFFIFYFLYISFAKCSSFFLFLFPLLFLFSILKAKSDFSIPPVEYREVGGAAFMQRRNDVLFSQEVNLEFLSCVFCSSPFSSFFLPFFLTIFPQHIANVVTESKEFSPEASRDLILASITLKYTQSNSVG